MSRPSVVVVGDALLDVDLVGAASRLAPDSPVPVVEHVAESARPGGAALAAALTAADQVDVTLVTALGDDPSSRRLRDVLPSRVCLVELPLRGELPRKVRVRAGEQSLARLDYGDDATVGQPDVALLEAAIETADAVLVSDYGRGVTAAVHELLAIAAANTAVVWDPHPKGSVPVADVATVTPNRLEAALFTGGASSRSLTDVAAHAKTLVGKWRAKSVCVTMGGDGALLSFGDDSPLVLPAPRVTCVDPCGAGDRFAGAFAAALASGALPSEATATAVAAASEFVRVGVARALRPAPTRHDAGDSGDAFQRARQVRDNGGVVVATGGCFDLLHAGHVETLRTARALGDFLVVCLNSDHSVSRLKGAGRPLVPQADRAQVLNALDCVDAVVVFDEDTPTEVLHKLRPHIWAKGGDYNGRTLPEASALATWGGQAVVLPYLKGRSTSALVSAAANRVRG